MKKWLIRGLIGAGIAFLLTRIPYFTDIWLLIFSFPLGCKMSGGNNAFFLCQNSTFFGMISRFVFYLLGFLIGALSVLIKSKSSKSDEPDTDKIEDTLKKE